MSADSMPSALSPGRLRLRSRAARMARIAELDLIPLVVLITEFDLIAAAIEMIRAEDPAAWDEAVRTVEAMRAALAEDAAGVLQ